MSVLCSLPQHGVIQKKCSGDLLLDQKSTYGNEEPSISIHRLLFCKANLTTFLSLPYNDFPGQTDSLWSAFWTHSVSEDILRWCDTHGMADLCSMYSNTSLQIFIFNPVNLLPRHTPSKNKLSFIYLYNLRQVAIRNNYCIIRFLPVADVSFYLHDFARADLCSEFFTVKIYCLESYPSFTGSGNRQLNLYFLSVLFDSRPIISERPVQTILSW